MMNVKFHTCALWSIALMYTFTGYSASPSVGLSTSSITFGDEAAIVLAAADADNNLNSLRLYASGPGLSGWNLLQNYTISGGSALRIFDWTPMLAGRYQLKAEAWDSTQSIAVETEFDVFAESRTLRKFSVSSGQGLLITADGELVTTVDNSALSTRADTGSNLILWTSGRTILNPGFKAAAGANFRAAVDFDLDSYSDVDEATDTDGDGMFDAWESDHGLNLASAADKFADPDGDGTSNIVEFNAGLDPQNIKDGQPLPAGFDLILKLADSFHRVKFSDWSITAE